MARDLRGDPAQPASRTRLAVRVRRDFRHSQRSWPVLPRPRRLELLNARHDALLRTERLRASARRVVVVWTSRTHHRDVRHGAVADQLLDRRDHQPEAQERSSVPQTRQARTKEAMMSATAPAPPSVLPRSSRRAVLTVETLTVVYEFEHPVTAVKNATISRAPDEILGLAGESGCGKTTLAYAINRLHKPPAHITSGRVLFHDRDGSEVDLLAIEAEELRAFRWSKLSMVFQGAMNALNPVTSIKAQLDDVLVAHDVGLNRKQRRARCVEVLQRVGVDPVWLNSFPHELSGGMRQRVMIAMAMLLEPQVMIMDEPTTALDVVVQRDILREIVRLRDELNFAVIFITHDLPLLLEISDRIAIMLKGEIVELDTADRIYQSPQHPYTKKLLASFPSLSGSRGSFIRTGVETSTQEESA